METLQPKLRFSEFKGNWKRKKIGDISIKINSGKTPLGGEAVYTESGILFIRSQNVLDSKLSYDNSTFIDEKMNDTMKNSIVKSNDILLNITGASLGRSCVVPNDFKIGNVNQHVCIIRLNSENNSNYIQSILASDNGQTKLKNLSTGSGREGLNFQSIKDLEVYLPSLEEQTKIANFLSSVDEKLNLLKEKKTLLEDYKKGIMQKIFSQEIRFKDENGEDFEDWEVKTIGESCNCLDSQRKPLNGQERQLIQGGYPYWGANNIMDYIDDYIFDETIVLLAEDGGNFNEFKTKPIANLSKGKCWVNNHTHVLKGKENVILNEFLFYSLVHKDITGFVSGGTRSKLIKSEMLKIPIDLPSIDEQTKIANFLSAIDEKIELVSNQIQDTQEYKKGLLQQMFV